MMKLVCLALGLMVLGSLTEVQAATGDVGQACLTGDLCTDANAYCDTTCKCKAGFFQDGTGCLLAGRQPCHSSQCYHTLTCINGVCLCDNVTAGYLPGNTGDTSCACPADQTYQDGKCRVHIGKTTCSSVNDCVQDDGVLCSSSTCGCDSANHFTANGLLGCQCDTGYVKEGTVCKAKIDTACDSVGDCVSGLGVLCSTNCGCDASKNFVAVGAKTACECDTGYHLDGDVCKAEVSTQCSATSDCVTADGVTCDVGASNVCVCGADLSVVAGNLACECTDTDYYLESGVCKAKVDSNCSAVACISADDVSCNNVDTCECDASKNLVPVGNKLGCECAPNYHMEGGVCKVTGGNDCSSVSCVTADGMDCDSTGNTCECDASKNFAAVTSGATSCVCASGYKKEGSVCKAKTGTACGTHGCVTGLGITCVSSTCKCDTTKFFSDLNGLDACTCDNDHVLDGTTCKSKVLVECTSTTCMDVPGLTCADDGSGTNKCLCDASAYFDATNANSGDTLCGCQTGYVLQENKCLSGVGKTCNDSTPACAHGMVCDKQTSKCRCDTANNYLPGNDDDLSCSCNTAISASMTLDDGRTYCGKKNGGTCMMESNACYSDLVCKSTTVNVTIAGGSTVPYDLYACDCPTGKALKDDGTCSSGTSIAISVILLVMGLMTSAVL